MIIIQDVTTYAAVIHYLITGNMVEFMRREFSPIQTQLNSKVTQKGTGTITTNTPFFIQADTFN